MEPRRILAWALSALVLLHIQTLLITAAQAAEQGAIAPRPEYDQTQEFGPHHRIWTTVNLVTNELGAVTIETNRYIQIQNGLHYKNPDGQGGLWLPSQELIELHPDGAVARFGAFNVIFSPNANSRGTIDFLTPDGIRQRSTAIGLSYYSRKTGQSILIAEVQDSIGELLPPNRLIYRDALSDPATGVEADLLYVHKTGRFHQEAIVRYVPPPEAFGMSSESVVLELMTEFIESPMPEKKVSVLKRELDGQKRQQMVDPDVIDETLIWGSMRIGPGRAFNLNEQGNPPGPGSPSARVTKRFQVINQRQVLFEQVEYDAIKPIYARSARRQEKPAQARPSAARAPDRINRRPGKRVQRPSQEREIIAAAQGCQTD